jgi:hypothetical protein
MYTGEHLRMHVAYMLVHFFVVTYLHCVVSLVLADRIEQHVALPRQQHQSMIVVDHRQQYPDPTLNCNMMHTRMMPPSSYQLNGDREALRYSSCLSEQFNRSIIQKKTSTYHWFYRCVLFDCPLGRVDDIIIIVVVIVG